jgi:hypothetical protein
MASQQGDGEEILMFTWNSKIRAYEYRMHIGIEDFRVSS